MPAQHPPPTAEEIEKRREYHRKLYAKRMDENFPDSTYFKDGLDAKVNYWNPINWF